MFVKAAGCSLLGFFHQHPHPTAPVKGEEKNFPPRAGGIRGRGLSVERQNFFTDRGLLLPQGVFNRFGCVYGGGVD